MVESPNVRLIFLNRLISDSVTRAPSEHKAPTHGASELLEMLKERAEQGLAVEYFDASDDDDESARLRAGQGHDCIRLAQIEFGEIGGNKFATLLFEFIKESEHHFPVVNTSTFQGRELSGEESERGAAAAHLVVSLPSGGAYDDGSYRCAIEAVHSINRRDIEVFFARQLRRSCQNWSFGVTSQKGRKKPTSKEYKYHPRLGLFADVGRRLELGTVDGRSLSHMVFLKRGERQNLGKGTSLTHKDIIADLEVKISARQAPSDPEDRKTWLQEAKSHFEGLGYTTRLYFRSTDGGTVSGSVHSAIAGAADLLMCPKTTILLDETAPRWRATIDQATSIAMKGLLIEDRLWERAK
jgi:hypothetical protein